MLENKVIVYDDSCPMCKIYTYWFVAVGLLKQENRVGFATASPEITANTVSYTHLTLPTNREV